MTDYARSYPSGLRGRQGAGSFPKDPLGRRKVMVVDDDVTILIGVAAFLDAHGYQVIQRSEAIGTTAAITRERPDIIIMDVEMPGLSGDAISALLNKRGDDLCLIFYSSRPQAEIDQLALQTGAHAAIRKGDLRDFMQAFEAALPMHLRAARS